MARSGDAVWSVLLRGGLPLAGRPPGPPPSSAELAAAVRAVRDVPPAPGSREADALRAWLLAWRQHWPESFVAAFGDLAPTIARWRVGGGTDANRLLKLRRIALANLASVL